MTFMYSQQGLEGRYDIVTRVWSTLTPLPIPLSNIVCGVIGTQVFVIGGRSSSHSAVDTVWIYDTILNTWTLGPKLPVTCCAATSVTMGESIFVFGGVDKDYKVVADCHRLDWKSSVWTVIA